MYTAYIYILCIFIYIYCIHIFFYGSLFVGHSNQTNRAARVSNWLTGPRPVHDNHSNGLSFIVLPRNGEITGNFITCAKKTCHAFIGRFIFSKPLDGNMFPMLFFSAHPGIFVSTHLPQVVLHHSLLEPRALP